MSTRYIFDNSLDERGKPKHLHTLDGKPLTGTSSVLNIMAKPLTWWAVGEGLKTLGWMPINETVDGKRVRVKKELREEAALKWLTEHSEQLFNSETAAEDWLKMLDKAYYAHDDVKDTAADKGKDLHAELEKYVKFCIEKKEGKPAGVKAEGIQDFIKWSVDNVEKFLWSEVHMYSEEYWLGGISDAGAVLKTGETAVIDFKSSKAAYASQFFQCGGYQIQLEENGGFTHDGNKILDRVKASTHIIIPFGAPEFSPSIVHDVEGRNKEAFLAALNLLRAKKLYESD